MKNLLLLISVFCVNFIIIFGNDLDSGFRLKYKRKDREDGKPYDNQLSILLIFDTTISSTDYKSFKENCFTILDKLDETNFNDLIYDYILVILNEPYDLKIVKKRKKDEIKTEINKIQLKESEKCTQPVLSSLISGLEESLPRSIAFVFTDAIPNDVNRKDKVFSYISDKNFTINFFLTSYCTNKMEEYAVYYRIAKQSKGRLNDLNPKQLSTVLGFLDTLLQKQRTSLDHFESGYKGNFSIPFYVDNTITNLSISISGNDIDFTLITPNGIEYEDYLVETQIPTSNVIIVNKPMAGKWFLIYESSISSSVKIFYTGFLNFQYGFSDDVISNISDTKITPHKGKNILTIFPSNSSLLKDLVDIELVLHDKDMDIENEVISFKLPLLKIELEMPYKTIYRTELFSSPNIQYKLYIHGHDNAGNFIHRKLSTNIIPEEAITEDSLPEISIEIKHYDSLDNVQITCSVMSLVPINIQWLKDDVFIKELDPDHSAELNLDLKEISQTDSTAGELTCFARSMNGEIFSKINITDLLSTINARMYKPIEKKVIIIERNLDKINNEMIDINLIIGDNIELICLCNECESKPIEDYSWISRNLVFTNSTPEQQDNMIATRFDILNNFTNSTIIYKLKIENIIDDDILECKLGDLMTKFNLIVSTKPIRELIDDDIEEDYNVQIGESLSLHCSVESKSEVTYTWYKDGHQLITNNTNVIVFNNITIDDAGNYQCVAENNLGKLTMAYNVTVLYKPRILKISNNMKVLEDTEFTLECIGVGNPLPILTWFKDRKYILSTTKIKSNDNLTDSILTNETIYKINPLKMDKIKEATVSGLVNINKEKNEISFKLKYKNMTNLLAKNYSCLATNNLGRNEKTVKLSLVKSPEFIKSNEMININTMLGIPLQLSCQSMGIPKPTTKWLFNNNDLNKTTIDYFENNQIILLKNVDAHDNGNFTCIVMNKYGTINRSYLINVQHKPSHIDDFIKERNLLLNETLISRDIIKIRANFSNDIIIDCPIISNPVPIFQWSKLNSKTGEQTIFNTTGPYFKIWNIQESVMYICVAKNQFGETSILLSLIVQKSPILKSPNNEIINTDYGNTIILDCELEENNLPTTIYWIQNNKYIYHKSFYNKTNLKVIKNEEKLVIYNVTKADEGDYLCYGSNILNYTSKNFKLSVIEKVSWSQWSPWSACSASCGPGMKKRIRSCLLQDGTSVNNSRCPGINNGFKKCSIKSCFVDDDWTEWSGWSQCSKTCINEVTMERSIKLRSRKCNIIENQYCDYKDIDIHKVECDVPTCPRSGWSSWSEWSPCSATCGSGKQMRTRHCNNVDKKCVGAKVKFRKCFLMKCDGKNICSYGYKMNTTINLCEDINECNNHPCIYNELCVNIPGSYHCILY